MTEHPRTGVGAPDSGNGGTDHPTVQLPPVPSVGAPPAAAGGETPTRSVAGFRTQRLDPTAYGAYYSGPDEGPASPAERPPYRLEPVPHTPYPELATTTLLRPVKPPPSEGWRRLLYLLSGRLINAGEGPRAAHLNDLVAQVNRPLRGCYRIAVLSLKGGVGKTTITATLGATFADLRGDRVVAVDANPDRGTLSQKVPLETPATVRHLLRDADGIERYSDVRGYTSKGPSGLEVLASDSDPASSDAFSADDYTRTLDILERFYGLVLTDCGTGLLHSAMSRLRGWRSITRQQGDSVEVSAEKGYLREFGNLVFHFALLGLLVAVAVGKLFGYEGNVIVIADGGPGFCSASPAAFDSFRAGNTVDGTSLHPICVRVNNFQAHYLPSGQATSFAADIDYQADPATADLIANSWRPYRLQVNHPLRVGGDRVYLQGHGYAPTFTVTFPDGQTRTSTVQWRPDNPQTLLSAGVVRIDPPAGSYPNPDERRKHQIAIQGLLAPTEQLDGTLLSSRFPALNAPAVAIDIYRGDTGLDSGRPQSLFTLDHRLIEQGRLVKEKRVNLRAGQQVRIDQGPAAGTVVRFDGAVPFVNLQVSHDPGQSWVLVFAITMMAGLLVSLLVRRRRVWARITPTTAGTVNVELGGLTRTDNSGWGAEFERLTGRLLAGFEARSPDMAEAAAGTGRDVD